MAADTSTRLLFALFLVCYAWPVDLDPGVNVLAHMDQAAAIVAHGTLSIDAFMAPPEGPNTVDWARSPDGRTYPSKAPGAAFAAVPVFAVLYAVERAAGIEPFAGDWFRRNIILANLVVNAAGSALAMAVLLVMVRSAGISLGAAVAGVIAVGLGTSYFPYATTYYSHNLAANFVIGAAYFAFVARRSRTTDMAAGALAGCAVLCEYSAALAALAFGCALALTRPRSLMPFIVGGLPVAIVLAWYHAAVFGSPFVTPYAFLNPALAPPGGDFLTVPQLSTVLSLTISPYRGILFYSPVVVLALAGAWRLARPRRPAWPDAFLQRRRLLVGLGLALFALFFAFHACYYVWWGGWTAGPRYIIPGLVLLAPAIAAGFCGYPRLGAALLAVSVAHQLAIALSAIQVSDDVLDPLFDVVYPRLWQGNVQRSTLGAFIFGLPSRPSIAVLLLLTGAAALVLARHVVRAEAGRTSSCDGS